MRRVFPFKHGYPPECNIPLKHAKQRYSWDCGLSCLSMTLGDKQREHFYQNFSEICRRAGFNKSTWTIDLCHLLFRYDVPHTFKTLTLGVRGDYRQDAFYEKVFSKDEERVNRLFARAVRLGLDVRPVGVSIGDILQHLRTGRPAIVLTNSRLLNCATCKHVGPHRTPAYEGHYVVACGYHAGGGVIYYRNPAFHDHVCSMKFSAFDEARKAFGTDEDIIFIHGNS